VIELNEFVSVVMAGLTISGKDRRSIAAENGEEPFAAEYSSM
jgi:hypothetical protein